MDVPLSHGSFSLGTTLKIVVVPFTLCCSDPHDLFLLFIPTYDRGRSFVGQLLRSCDPPSCFLILAVIASVPTFTIHRAKIATLVAKKQQFKRQAEGAV